MYLTHRPSGDLVKVLNLEALFDPFRKEVSGRFHAGQEMQEPATFAKGDLVFSSEEYLPRCWLDTVYKTKLRIAGS
ncbi:MAG TPA: hypothetical protein VN277_02490 [Acidiferrobacterales bacterium]|nr:hypothetical protein [Acidiferrobacterales bacterium]